MVVQPRRAVGGGSLAQQVRQVEAVEVDPPAEFRFDDGLARGADGEVDVAVGLQKDFQEPHGIRRA